jgi:RNA polymerase sigma factor (sigma-70 family)
VSDGRSPPSFEEFFQTEYPVLVRACFLLTADQAEAEEVAQEAMARAFERWEHIAGMESPGGYVYRIAVNLNRRRLRHLSAWAKRLLAMGPNPDSADVPEVSWEIAEAIGSLSRGQREAFMLVEWLGMSAEEAGRVLRIAPPSVRSRIHRARATLRDRLRDDGGNHG